MHSVEEMTTWTVDEAAAAIVASLRAPLRFEESCVAGLWVGRLLDGEGAVLWKTVPSPDRRIMLIESYVKMHVAVGEKPKHPIWSRRLDENQLHAPIASGVEVPDPEDLDPSEIAKYVKK